MAHIWLMVAYSANVATCHTQSPIASIQGGIVQQEQAQITDLLVTQDCVKSLLVCEIVYVETVSQLQ